MPHRKRIVDERACSFFLCANGMSPFLLLRTNLGCGLPCESTIAHLGAGANQRAMHLFGVVLELADEKLYDWSQHATITLVVDGAMREHPP